METEVKLKPFVLRSYYKKELQLLYHQNEFAFRTWMASMAAYLGPKIGRDYTPLQIMKILKVCGPPEGFYITDQVLEQMKKML
jgi:hypothetical protein